MFRPARTETLRLSAMRRATEAAPRQRTLVLAVPVLIIGGAERLLSQVVHGLAEAGWRVIVFSTEVEDGTGGDAIGWFEAQTAEVYALPRFLLPQDWRDFVDYVLESRRPDALLIAGSRFFYDMLPLLAQRYPRMARLDLLFNAEGHTAKHMEHQPHLTGTLCANREVMAWLTRTAGWSAEQVRCIPSGIDTTAFHPGPQPSALAAQLGIGPEDMVVGCTGTTCSVGDFAARILGLMGLDKPIVRVESRIRPARSEVLKLVSGNSKARELMGWSPQVPLDDGLRQTIDFVSRHRHLYRSAVYTV